MSTSKLETSLLYFVECFIKDNTKNAHLSSACSLIQVQFEEKKIYKKNITFWPVYSYLI